MSHGLARYAGRRLLMLIPQLFLVSVATFALIQLLPGNPAVVILGPNATPEGIAELEKSMGLSRPVVDQYTTYVGHAVQGNLGRSWFTGQEVLHDLMTRVPATLELIGGALIIGVIVALALGAAPALRGRTGRRSLPVAIYMRLAGSFPDFWVALVALYVFFFKLRIAPAPVGRLSVTATPPPKVTGMYTVDALLAGDLHTFADALAHLALPTIVLGLVVAPGIARIVSASVDEALASEYVQYARLMGFKSSVITRYTARNALPPVLTTIGIYFVFLLGGAVLVEKIFSWNGFGQYAVDAVLNSDFAAIQGFLLLSALFTVVVYLIVDLIHAVVDPRVAGGS